jgi:hypothetical protein
MNSANQNLVEKIDAAYQFVERSEFTFSAGISKEHTLTALEDLKRQVVARGSVDAMEARMLFAPSGGLEEVALQNGWGREFLELAQEIEQVLVKPKEKK